MIHRCGTWAWHYRWTAAYLATATVGAVVMQMSGHGA